MICKILILPIRFYQKYISKHLPPSCRFYPTCSQYAIEAIEKHGAFLGIVLGCMRILRCNPFFKGGFDPVPDEFLRHKKKNNDQ